MVSRIFVIFLSIFILSSCKSKQEMAPVATQPVMEQPASEQWVDDSNTSVTSQELEMFSPIPNDETGARVGDRVYFAYDSAALTSNSQSTLDRQAAWLRMNPSVSITVEGHCDERGTREYNLALGERRANSVKSYLINSGIDPRRISLISYGKERPAILGSTPIAWAQNRRGVTVIHMN